MLSNFKGRIRELRLGLALLVKGVVKGVVNKFLYSTSMYIGSRQILEGKDREMGAARIVIISLLFRHHGLDITRESMIGRPAVMLALPSGYL